MAWTPIELRTLLSADLHGDNLNRVVREIQRIQASENVIGSGHLDSLLQGDVYSSVPCVSRHGGACEIARRRVMLISNSCDVSQENVRAVPLELTVVPVLRLSRYRQMLVDFGIEETSCDDAISAIKRQEKTNLIYLPYAGGLPEEMVALLDRAQSMTHEQFQEAGEPQREAVLTQRGFWLLLIKLSIHFQRPHEGVSRAA